MVSSDTTESALSQHSGHVSGVVVYTNLIFRSEIRFLTLQFLCIFL